MKLSNLVISVMNAHARGRTLPNVVRGANGKLQLQLSFSLPLSSVNHHPSGAILRLISVALPSSLHAAYHLSLLHPVSIGIGVCGGGGR